MLRRLDCSNEQHPPHNVMCHTLFLSVFLSVFYLNDSLQDYVALKAVIENRIQFFSNSKSVLLAYRFSRLV